MNLSVLNDFVFRIALAPVRGAKFADYHFKKRSEAIFNDFDVQMALVPQHGANFAGLNLRKSSEPAFFFSDFDFQIGVVQTLRT